MYILILGQCLRATQVSAQFCENFFINTSFDRRPDGPLITTNASREFFPREGWACAGAFNQTYQTQYFVPTPGSFWSQALGTSSTEWQTVCDGKSLKDGLSQTYYFNYVSSKWEPSTGGGDPSNEVTLKIEVKGTRLFEEHRINRNYSYPGFEHSDSQIQISSYEITTGAQTVSFSSNWLEKSTDDNNPCKYISTSLRIEGPDRKTWS